jgi:TP53 regulating kinase and related kinases
MKIIKRGAEAVLYLENGQLVKERLRKNYRLPEIDVKLRKFRTRKEAKLIDEAKRAGVDTPRIFSVDDKDFKIRMEFIDGQRIKELFNTASEAKIAKVSEEIGRMVGKLHSNCIVHGDLTTSNIILKDGKVFFIDFGLGETSGKAEDLAMDLSVLKEAIKSTHYKHLNLLWNSFIKGYEQTNDNFNKVLDTLNGIEKRGRYVER